MDVFTFLLLVFLVVSCSIFFIPLFFIAISLVFELCVLVVVVVSIIISFLSAPFVWLQKITKTTLQRKK